MSRNHVLLINPWIYDFAAYDLWVKPLGLLYVESLLQRNGYKTHLIDCLDRHHPELLRMQGRRRPKMKRYGTGPFHKEMISKPDLYQNVKRRYGRYGITEEILRKDVKSIEKPDVVLVTSGMTYWYPGPFRAIQIVKEHFPGVPVVLGGTYATLCPEHAQELSGADYVVRGEGELEALRLADELTGHRSSFWPDPEDLDSYPWPAHDSAYRTLWVPLLTSRGCPYRCSYCASHQLFPRFRQRDPTAVIEEIEHAYRKLRTRAFVFFDDALLANSSIHIRPLLQDVIRRNYKCTFHTPNGLHPRHIDRELADLMYRSGFRTVRLSFETANPNRQKELGLKVTGDDLSAAVDHLKSAGYEGSDLDVYVLSGLPGQSLEEIMESIVSVARLGVKTRLAQFSPIPGTIEWERAAEICGFTRQTDPLMHNNSIYPLLPKEIDSECRDDMQRFVNIFNTAIDQNVNLLGTSSISRIFQQALLKKGS
jgi:radical SAM superfamily enzyme YgiQ (UPF0313 family)